MNINNYGTLSSTERHEQIEQTQNRDKITYLEGINQFIHLIKTDDKVSLAFNNFFEHKETEFKNLNNKDVLLFAGLDKFKKEIYFIIKNSGNKHLSFYIYKINENTCSRVTKNLRKEGAYDMTFNHIIQENYQIQSVEQIKWDSQFKNIEEIWNNCKVNLFYKNPNDVVGDRFQIPDCIENIEYLNDESYQNSNKTFSSILSKNDPLDSNKFYPQNNNISSTFNSAHTTLLPADILSNLRSLPKNARSAIHV